MGKTAAGDVQRFGYYKQTLHRTFSHKFNDFAIEFYTFVADNFAPIYNLAKEATDRDNSKVLDGHLYNVSDLDPDEWFFDTGGYTEINFAAFAMLGKFFAPGLKILKIYASLEAGHATASTALKRLTGHAEKNLLLRHTFSVACIQKGISTRALQEILGHDQPATTEIYLNLSPEDVIREFHSKW